MDNNYEPRLTLTFDTNVNGTKSVSVKHYREKFPVEYMGVHAYTYRSHRLDGPAVESTDGRNKWYYHGEEVKVNSQEEFEKYLKLKAFW